MLHLFPELTLIRQDIIAGWEWVPVEGLSSVFCWEEKRVEDDGEVVDGHPQITINQEDLFLSLGHPSPKSSWMNLEVPA